MVRRFLAGAIVAVVLLPWPSSAGYERRYVVPEAMTLGELAVLLYGTGPAFLKIARWNGIKPPYQIHPGQRLVLREPPIAKAKGERKLLEMWRKKLGVELPSAPAPVVATPQAPIPDRIEPPSAPVPPQVRAIAEERLVDGQELMEAGQKDRALEELRAAREARPEHPAAWILEIRLLRELGREDEARERARELFEVSPALAAIPYFKDWLGP